MENQEALNILRGNEIPWGGNRHFRIRTIQPHRSSSLKNEGFGPLLLVMHCYLEDITIPMHEHRNDEILSYVWSGKMIHKDSIGHEEVVTANNLMMMNAGKSFYHEESSDATEALQILMKPSERDLSSAVRFYKRDISKVSGWQLLAGHSDANAPLEIRNNIVIYDHRAKSGEVIEVPKISGLTPWLYVMDGKIEVNNNTLGKGDAISGNPNLLNHVKVLDDTTLVLFLANVDE